MSTYRISVEKLFVERNQRTGTINFEGLLELQGKFYANNVETMLYPSAGSHVTARQNDTVPINIDITTVSNLISVPIRAEIWELEPGGGQGGTDHGNVSDTLILDGTAVIKKDLTVVISADNWKEKSGRIVVTFVATRV